MNYNSFATLLTEKKSLTSTDIRFFVKFPAHQRDQLFRLACTDSSIDNAQQLMSHLNISGNFWTELVPLLLITKKIPPENVEWLLTFNPFPDLGKKYMNIMSVQSPPVWEIIFSRLPLNLDKTFHLMKHCVEYQIVEGIYWIVEQQKNQRLPFHYEMPYFCIYYAFNNEKNVVMPSIIHSLSQCSSRDLDMIISHLSHKLYQLNNYSIQIENNKISTDKGVFSNYLKQAISTELFKRLDTELPEGSTVKYHKI